MFFTGDAPLIKIDGDGVECGIDTPGAMLFFPLSPSRMLFMTDRVASELDDPHYGLTLDLAEACNVVTRANSPAFLFSQARLTSDQIAGPTPP